MKEHCRNCGRERPNDAADNQGGHCEVGGYCDWRPMIDADKCHQCGSWSALVNGLCSDCIDKAEPKQLVHQPAYVGGPCQRCGLVYCRENSYVPCFVEGDTRATWLARHWDSLFPDVDVETLEQHIVLRVSGQAVADAEIEAAERLGVALLEMAKVNCPDEFMALHGGLAAFLAMMAERVGIDATMDAVHGIFDTIVQLRDAASTAKGSVTNG